MSKTLVKGRCADGGTVTLRPSRWGWSMIDDSPTWGVGLIASADNPQELYDYGASTLGVEWDTPWTEVSR